MAEFSYNNTLFTSSEISPFYAICGKHPRYMIQSHPDIKLPLPSVLKDLADNLASLNNYFKSKML